MDWNIVVIGISIVFTALVSLWVIMVVFSAIVTKFLEPKKTVSSESIPKSEHKSEEEPAPLSSATASTDIDDDPQNENELIAVLAAAIQASSKKTAQSTLVIKSYKRIRRDVPVWNRVSRESH